MGGLTKISDIFMDALPKISDNFVGIV